MEEIVKICSSAPCTYFQYFFVGAVILVLLRYFFYRTHKVKRFSFLKKTIPLVILTDYKPEALHLYFGDKEIKDVFVTRIALWNSGNEKIKYDDIGESPLFVAVNNEEETSILECMVDYKQSGARTCDFAVDSEGKHRLVFDDILKKEGVILQVVHSGDVENLLLNFQLEGKKGTIELDKYCTIHSVNGKMLWIRVVWAKVMNKIGFVPEGRYKGEIFVLEMLIALFVGWLSAQFHFSMPLLERLWYYDGRGVFQAMFFFALFDILLFIIYKLLMHQKMPEELNERL